MHFNLRSFGRNRLPSEAFWVFFGQVGMAVGGLFAIKLLTLMLSPAEFGQLAIANTVVLLIGANIFGPIGQGFMRFWSISQHRNEIEKYSCLSRKYLKRLLGLVAVFSFVFGLILYLIKLHDWSLLIMLATLTGAMTGWTGVRLNMLMAARKRKAVALVNSVAAFMKPLLAAGLLYILFKDAWVVMCGFLVSMGIVGWYTEKYYIHMVRSTVASQPVRNNLPSEKNRLGHEILKFAWPFFIWGIFSWLHQSCDRWALQVFEGADTVGVYAVINQLALYPLIFGSGFLSTFFLPIAYDRAGKMESTQSIKSANKVILAMIAFYAVGTAVLILLFSQFHRPLVLFISNDQFVELSYLLPWLTAAWALYYLGQMLSGYGLLANRPHVYILPISVSGIIAAGLTFLLADTNGPVGVVLALGIAGGLYASWFLILAVRMITTHQVKDSSPLAKQSV